MRVLQVWTYSDPSVMYSPAVFGNTRDANLISAVTGSAAVNSVNDGFALIQVRRGMGVRRLYQVRVQLNDCDDSDTVLRPPLPTPCSFFRAATRQAWTLSLGSTARMLCRSLRFSPLSSWDGCYGLR